MKYTLKD